LFVDEQIYQELPDFVVATVDKFAMMPWRGEAGMLFGRATHLKGLRRDARRSEGRDETSRGFTSSRIDLPRGVRGLIVIPEMREIRVQVSFSRLDSISSNLQGEFDFERVKHKPAALMLPTGNQKWLPVAEVRGEGIFLELDEDAVQAWERECGVLLEGPTFAHHLARQWLGLIDAGLVIESSA